MTFRVRLKAVHEQTGLTHYAVAKLAGVAINTVVRYTSEDEITLDRIEGTLVRLLKAYGLDWRDPDVVRIVEDTESPEMQTFSTTGQLMTA